jgi:hypothetical protein
LGSVVLSTHPGKLIGISLVILSLAIELSLLWRPLRYSPGTLDVSLVAPCRGEAQLFVDSGAGFSEQASKTYPIAEGNNQLSMTVAPGPMLFLKLALPACAGQFTVRALRASGRWRESAWGGERIRSRVTDVSGATLNGSTTVAELVVVGANPSVTLRAPGGITKQFERTFWLHVLGLLLVTVAGLELSYRWLSHDWRRRPLLRSPTGLGFALAALSRRQLLTLLTSRGPRLLAVSAVIVWMGCELLPDAWAGYRSSPRRAFELGRSLASGSFEERRLKAYGDCGNMGYGYVTGILHSYPRSDSLPIIKYADFDRPLNLLLPGWRTQVDENVLIGIGISEQDFQECPISDAQRRDVSRKDGKTLSRWTFQTALDYQLMSRVDLFFGSRTPRTARTVALSLIESPTRNNVLGSWIIQVPPGQPEPYSFVLPSPVRDFSQTRGATDFIFLAEEAGESSLENIRVYGSKVDGTGFVTVGRRESCFVAVQQELLSRIRGNPDDSWALFIEKVRNVPLP